MKNAGYTLVEVMVVVLLIGIGLSIVFMSTGAIYSQYAQECTRNITSELAKEKIAAMTREGKVYMHLYKLSANSGKDAPGVYIDEYENGVLAANGHNNVGKASVTVWYSIKDNPTADSDWTPIDETGIVIAFNKNDGSFKTIGEAWALKEPSYNPPNAGENYRQLRINCASSSKTITLKPETGKFSLTG